MMRKRPRSHPEIVIDVIVNDDTDYASYCWDENIICFGNMKNFSEKRIINTLLHELDHWAQVMYLDEKECMYCDIAYNVFELGTILPFLEFIDVFDTKGWVGWEKKEDEEYMNALKLIINRLHKKFL